MTRTSWILWLATIVHMVQGAAMIFDPAAGNATPTRILVDVFGPAWIGGAILILGSILALISMRRPDLPVRMAIILMMPQQVLLLLSGFSGAEAVFLSAYADGVVRNQSFILADQIPAIATAIFHTIAMVDVHSRLSLNETKSQILTRLASWIMPRN